MASTMSNTAPPPGAGPLDASLLRQTTLDSEDAAALLASLADCAPPPEELEWRRRLSRLRRSLTPKGPLPGKAGGE